jgi:hypothetical protein
MLAQPTILRSDLRTISHGADSDTLYVTIDSDMDLMSDVIIKDIPVLSHNISVPYRMSEKSAISDIRQNI